MAPTATTCSGRPSSGQPESGSFGETFGRPFPQEDGEFYYRAAADADQHDGLCVRPDSTSTSVVELFRATWERAKETFATLDLESPGQIPTRPYAKVTLGEMLVHMVDEPRATPGHMDIVRESIDGAAGRYAGDGNIDDDYDWAAYRERVEAGAREAQDRAES